MSKMIDDTLFLEGKESIDFFNVLRHPDSDALEQRDRFIRGNGKNIITINADGTGIINMADIILEGER